MKPIVGIPACATLVMMVTCLPLAAKTYYVPQRCIKMV
jgi:hypothetical protein